MKGLIYTWFLLAVPLMFPAVADSQDFIGMDKEAIKKEMNARYKTFKLNTSTVNHVYKYLKYEDNIREITILFFLSGDDKCTMIRKMYDYSNINDVEEELGKLYTANGSNKWTGRAGNTRFDVTLAEEEWFFTVMIKPSE